MEVKEQIFALLRKACEWEPDYELLAVIGSCFDGSDLYQITDAELKENLEALISTCKESPAARKRKRVGRTKES